MSTQTVRFEDWKLLLKNDYFNVFATNENALFNSYSCYEPALFYHWDTILYTVNVYSVLII